MKICHVSFACSVSVFGVCIFETVSAPESYFTLSSCATILPREQKIVVVECISNPASPIAMAVQHAKSTAQFHIGVSNSI